MNMLGVISEPIGEDPPSRARDIPLPPSPGPGRASGTASFADQMRALRTLHQRAVYGLPSLTTPISPSRTIQSITLDRDVVEAMSEPLEVTRDLRARSREVASEVVPQVADGLAEIHSNAKYTVETNAQACEANARENGEAVKQAKGSPEALNQFRAKMDAERDRTKADFDSKIDAWYAKATDLGEKHPSQQETILDGMKATVGTVVKALGEIGNALMKIASTIVSALEHIWNTVKQFFEPVLAIISLF